VVRRLDRPRLSFTAFVYFGYENRWFGLGGSVDSVDGVLNDGRAAAIKYLTGYVVEKSLSVDNIFVIAMIFGFFAVPAVYQHRVLFWGILGALVMRGAMIAIGAKLIAEFHWVLYVFGAFLIATAAKMLFLKTGETDPNRNVVVRLVRRFCPSPPGSTASTSWCVRVLPPPGRARSRASRRCPTRRSGGPGPAR